MISRVEALALSICREHQAFDPRSDAVLTLNPGLLKINANNPSLQPTTEDKTRIFSSFQGGYRALIVNIQNKCSGHTEAAAGKGKLTPDSSLAELCKTFKAVNVREVILFLQDVLEDPAINDRTKLDFFNQ